MKQVAISLVLIVVLLAGTGTGVYFLQAYLLEVSLLCLGITWLYSAVNARLSRREFLNWVITPPLLIAGYIVIYALAFAINTGSPLVPSLLAGRGAMYWLLWPLICMLPRVGFSRAALDAAFMAAIAISIGVYLLVYFTVDLQPIADRSHTELWAKAMVSEDSRRGITLKGADTLWVLAAVVSILKAFRTARRRPHIAIMYFMLGGVALSLIATIQIRSLWAAFLGALILYPIAANRRVRSIHLITAVVGAFFVVLALTVDFSGVIDTFLAQFRDDLSLVVRLASFEAALDTFAKYPLLGYGIASYHGTSFQDLFGETFFVADIGILGVLLMHGLVGVSIYVSLLFIAYRRLSAAMRISKRHDGVVDPMLIGFVVMTLMFVLMLPLQTSLLFPSGAVVMAFAMGYSRSYFDRSVGRRAAGVSLEVRRPVPETLSRGLKAMPEEQ